MITQQELITQQSPTCPPSDVCSRASSHSFLFTLSWVILFFCSAPTLQAATFCFFSGVPEGEESAKKSKILLGTNLSNLGLCQYITYTKTILHAVFFFLFVFFFKEFYYQNLSFFSFLFLWFFPSPHFLPPSWLGLQDTHQDTTKNLNLVHSFINTNLQSHKQH